MTNDVNDEITLKELILTIQEYWYELWRSWWKIGLIALPFVAFYAYKATSTPPKYESSLKFFVEGDGGSGGLGGLLGSFGFKSGSGKNNPYQILEVLQSNLFISEMLLEKGESGELLANEIIETYGIDKYWNSKLEDFKSEPNFRIKNTDSKLHTGLEKMALQYLIGVVKPLKGGVPLRTVIYNEDKGYYTIDATTLKEGITLSLINISFEKIKTFFEEKTLKGYKETRDIVKAKVDSFEQVIYSKMYQMNRFGDTNKGLVSLERGTKNQILQKEIMALSLAQGEAMKTYELADFNYLNQKAQFMVIDRPLTPITPIVTSIKLNILIGIILGAFVGAIIIIVRKIILNALK